VSQFAVENGKYDNDLVNVDTGHEASLASVQRLGDLNRVLLHQSFKRVDTARFPCARSWEMRVQMMITANTHVDIMQPCWMDGEGLGMRSNVLIQGDLVMDLSVSCPLTWDIWSSPVDLSVQFDVGTTHRRQGSLAGFTYLSVSQFAVETGKYDNDLAHFDTGYEASLALIQRFGDCLVSLHRKSARNTLCIGKSRWKGGFK